MNISKLSPEERAFLLALAEVIKQSRLQPAKEAEIDALINALRDVRLKYKGQRPPKEGETRGRRRL
jgi:hypothetical protein